VYEYVYRSAEYVYGCPASEWRGFTTDAATHRFRLPFI